MKYFCNLNITKMPCHEEVEEFFMKFAREMREQGEWIMDKYQHDWPNLVTKDEIREEKSIQDYEDYEEENFSS
jgi:hypothetical protein